MLALAVSVVSAWFLSSGGLLAIYIGIMTYFFSGDIFLLFDRFWKKKSPAYSSLPIRRDITAIFWEFSIYNHDATLIPGTTCIKIKESSFENTYYQMFMRRLNIGVLLIRFNSME